MDKENNNDDSVDITAILNKVIDKTISEKAVAYVQKELSAENILKHFEVVCTTGGHTMTCDEDIEYEENRIKYPVYIDGAWYNIQDIDIPCMKKYKQSFYDQVTKRAIHCMLEYENNIGFWGIRKNYQELEFMFSCLLELYIKDDYEKKIKKAISNAHYKSRTKQYYKAKGIIVNPLQHNTYCQEITIESFEKDVLAWDIALNNYKRENAYINRIHYLIEQMDELEKLRISFLKERIANQKEQYLKLLSK